MKRRLRSYQILEEIATGAHATVYRAWDSRTSQMLALKVMRPHLSRDPAYLGRFEREANLASSLNHPNVVRIFEVGTDGDSHFIAMEFLPLTLDHLLRSGVPIPLDRAVDIGLQIALGLDAADQQGIVHRDIKPQNILLTPDGVAKITDFGIARTLDGVTMTDTSLVMGTPQYMAPEQAKGVPSDARSDIYSVGVILYHMVAGRLPFNGDSPWQIIRQHVEVKATPVKELLPQVPQEISDAIQKCLGKDPGARFQTPVALADALEALQIRIGQPPFTDLSDMLHLANAHGSGRVAEPITLPIPPVHPRWKSFMDGRTRAVTFGIAAVLVFALYLPLANSLGFPVPFQTETPQSTPTPVASTPFPSVSLPPDTATEVFKAIAALAAGEAQTASMTPEDVQKTGVARVNIVAAQNIPPTILKVQKLDNSPVAPPPPGQIYSYLDVTLFGISQPLMPNSTVDFRVSEVWLAQRSLRAEDVALWVYAGTWVKMPIIASESTAGFREFRGGTQGLPLLAIAGSKPAPPTPTPNPVEPDKQRLTFGGTGTQASPSFTVMSTPWKLEYQASWSGQFTLYIPSPSGNSVILNQEVRAGFLYETFVYDQIGTLTLAASAIPADGHWSVTVTENATTFSTPPLPGPPGTVLAYGGLGVASSPPVNVRATPWLLRFQTTWTGQFTLYAIGDNKLAPLVNGAVSAGVIYETWVYDFSGLVHLSVLQATPTGRWAVWVVGDPVPPTVDQATRDRGVWFTYTGTGLVKSPPFDALESPWRLVYVTTWTGPLTMTVRARNGSTTSVVSQDVRAGIIYETHVYGLTGPLYLSLDVAPPGGTWSVSITRTTTQPMTGPLSPQSAVYSYAGISNSNTSPATLASGTWKLVILPNWTGRMTIRSEGRIIASLAVTAGLRAEVPLGNLSGTLYFTVSEAPPDSLWTIWIAPEIPPA